MYTVFACRGETNIQKSPRPKNSWKPWRDNNTHDINSNSKNNVEIEENGHGDGGTQNAAGKNGSSSGGGGVTAIASDGQSLSGRDASGMSLGSGEGLLCRDGGLTHFAADSGSNGLSYSGEMAMCVCVCVRMCSGVL